MFLKSKFFRVSCALILLLAMFSFVFADTIRLKDGSIIKGKIVNFNNGQFTVLIGEGTRQRRMNFYADEIESIEFDGTSQIAVINKNTQLPQKNNTNSTSNNSNSNTTVITVGQNTNPTPSPTPKSTPVPTPTPTVTNTNSNKDDDTIIISNPTNSNQTNSNTTTTTNKPKSIELKVKVLADNTSNGWTNSGWVVRKGQKIRITSRGNISLGNGNFSTPNGRTNLPDPQKLMPTEPTGGLIAVIGDDNNDFIFIGTDKVFTATREGSLFLGVNDGNLDDNSGSFDVTVEILPE